jgi:serine/threonine protein kinase
MSKSFADDFLESFDKNIALPQEITERFNVAQYLATNDYGETLLLEEKDGGKLYVLKCFNKADISHADNEPKILSGLNHKGLPNYRDENASFKNDEKLYVLREYLDGVSLDEYISEKNITEAQAIDIAAELCEIISYLHAQSPPIIHRDIKPSNIIINPQGQSVKLIDFGIARKYSETAENDTVNFGTHKFAPPEQYGFAQTDCRADIYALGIVLRYMLTGTPEEQIQNKALEKIAAKCSAFSPNMRYKNAGEVKAALIRHKKQTKPKIICFAVSLFTACVILCVGFFVGRYTDILRFAPEEVEEPEEPEIVIDENAPYDFVEPLIEQAVRLMLRKNEDEPITRKELGVISGLYILGDYVAASRNEYHEYHSKDYANIAGGTIQSLDDIKYMKNINDLYLMRQPLSNLSPLAGNTMLINVTIPECSILDYSPLLLLPNLINLNIGGNFITDFSCFQEIKSLYRLEIGGQPLKSISELGDISNIRYLDISCTEIENLDGIENAASLVDLSIRLTNIRDFSPLNGLPNFRRLQIGPEQKQYSDTLSRDDVEIFVVE